MRRTSSAQNAFYLMLTMLDASSIICSHLTFDKQQG